ncbi:MAG: Rieske 2Fe-2S domain-containing protein [Planctomycetaceae bacterium]|nr:Rieske 2Fe-2S domain-containing protein [Planctomycetaceae bacterium]
MSQPHLELHESPPGEPRRRFMTQILAAGIGLLVGAVPAVSGLAFFLDPLMRKKKAGGGDGFFKMQVTLEALEINGEPQLVKILMDRVDAWNTYGQQPVGAVYLRRTDKDKVVAFNSRCPHLGCAVDYKPAEKHYFCPCHTSTFGLDGSKQNEIPPRGLDSLEVQIRKGSEVWLKFQNFRATTPEKIPVG